MQAQPRIPFYPYPYSNAWKSTAPPTSPNEVEVKIVEQPAYRPPHGFPGTKSPAKDAIAAYSQARIEPQQQLGYPQELQGYPQELQEEEIARAGGARAKAVDNEPSFSKNQDPRGATTKNLKFSGNGQEAGDGYTKVVNNPRRTETKDGGTDGQSDWNQFSYGVVSDTFVHHDPYATSGGDVVDGERRTNAMGKIQKLMGGNGQRSWDNSSSWDVPRLEKRGTDVEKRDQAWPEHIQAKAEKMMKSAASMQDRGQSLMEADPAYQGNQKPASKAPGTAPSVPEKKKSIVPGKKNAPAPPPAPEKKGVPGKGKKEPAPKPAAAKEEEEEEEEASDDDPMMRNELPAKSGNAKKPKQVRPAPEQQQAKKPARGGKDKKYQSNSPKQGKRPSAKGGRLTKRDAVPEPEAEAVKGRSGDKVSPNKGKGRGGEGRQGGGKQSGGPPSHGGQSPSGRVRPNINQDRPQKKKDREAATAAASQPENKRGKGKGKALAIEDNVRDRFDEEYVDEVYYNECVVDEDTMEYYEEEDVAEGSLRKRSITTNRKVLPCGPPITIRKVLGAAAATAAPVAIHAPVAAHAQSHAVAKAAAPAPVVHQIPDGQIQDNLKQIQYVTVTIQAAAQTVTVDRVVQAAAQTVTVEKVVQAPAQIQYVTRQVQSPAETVVVQAPAQVQYVTVNKEVKVPVTAIVKEKEFVVQTVVKNQPYTLTEKINVPVTRQVTSFETETVAVAVPVTQTQVVNQPVTRIYTVKLPVTQTEQVIQQVTEQVAYPVTQTQVQKVYETLYPSIKAIPKVIEVVHEKEIIGEKQVTTNVEVVSQVPVVKTRVVCPVCEEESDVCECGTFDGPSGNEECRPAAGLDCVPRTAKELEAFFKAQLPDEFDAAAAAAAAK